MRKLLLIVGTLVVVGLIVVTWWAVFPESKPERLMDDREQIEVCYSIPNDTKDVPGYCQRLVENGLLKCDGYKHGVPGDISACRPVSIKVCDESPYPENSRDACRRWWKRHAESRRATFGD